MVSTAISKTFISLLLQCDPHLPGTLQNQFTHKSRLTDETRLFSWTG